MQFYVWDHTKQNFNDQNNKPTPNSNLENKTNTDKKKSQRALKSPHRSRLVEPKLLEIILLILELIRDPILCHFPYRIPSPRLGSAHSCIRDLNPERKRDLPNLNTPSPLSTPSSQTPARFRPGCFKYSINSRTSIHWTVGKIQFWRPKRK